MVGLNAFFFPEYRLHRRQRKLPLNNDVRSKGRMGTVTNCTVTPALPDQRRQRGNLVPGNVPGFPLRVAAPQVQLDSISRPGGNATAEEVPILRPDWDAQHEGHGGNRPVLDVARGHSLPGELPEIPI